MNILFSTLLSILVLGPITLWPGMKAPDFTATTTNGSKISLHDYKGKSNVLLYFYPDDLSRGCTIEACKFRDEKAKFAEANTVILGVSLNNQTKHQEFTTKDSLNFPLLVDTDSTICRAYGVPIMMGKYATRWSFLIGKDGNIVQVYKKVDPRTHGAEVLQDVWDYNKMQK
ncbi:MAG TPA: peroxiredoxin [Candidatus Kapabacteria bacterium]|jgi:peroxiredoxin Q/BCP